MTTTTPTFSGFSSITAFGNATRITIKDVSDPNPANWTIIGGFDLSQASATNIAANWTNAFGNFNITANDPTTDPKHAFSTNGLKKIEIYATDNAGAVGNVVTITFTLNAKGFPPIPPTTPPTIVTLALRASEAVVIGTPPVTYTKSSTPDFDGVTDTNTASVELWQVIGGVPTTKLATTTTIDSLTGAFTLKLPSMADGTYSVLARAVNAKGTPGQLHPLHSRSRLTVRPRRRPCL